MTLVTDWDKYYERPLATAKLTRRYTGSWLRTTMQKYASSKSDLEIVEFGGGNSCFFRSLVDSLPISRYDVADQNEKSLLLFEQQARALPSLNTATEQVDLLKRAPSFALADVVFSVGLIEHFTPEGTREVARRHFASVKDGGIVIITAPTPTWLYRLTRKMAEQLGIWRFPDERPLLPDEILRTAEGLGTPLLSNTLWPIVLTQQAIVWKAHNRAHAMG